MELNKRVVLILNEKIDHGRLLNAAAHLALGYGASRDEQGRTELQLLDYVDGACEVHPNISALSLIVLKATPTQLQNLRHRAFSEGLPCMSFTNTMTEGTYKDQLERTKSTPGNQIIYYGLLLFGTREQLDPLTRKFSLFRGPSNQPLEGLS